MLGSVQMRRQFTKFLRCGYSVPLDLIFFLRVSLCCMQDGAFAKMHYKVKRVPVQVHTSFTVTFIASKYRCYLNLNLAEGVGRFSLNLNLT